MASPILLSLPAGAAIASGGERQIAIQAQGARVTFSPLTEAMRHALRTLAGGGASEDQLAEQVGREDGVAGLSRFYRLLNQLGRRGWLLRSANDSSRRLATLVPCSRDFVYPARALEPDQPYVLSRFAYLRAEGGEVLLESPLSHARVLLHDGQAAALAHALARPSRPADLARQLPRLGADGALGVAELLFNADLIGRADETGTAAGDRAAALESWEFHDLLFHARSRMGRHSYPVGGTYRFVGRLPPPAALKETPATDGFPLERPDLDRLESCDPPFARVQERRRSIRDYGERPITALQLGEFLYRVGRVKECAEVEVATPHGPLRMALALRPYPGGGALHELELYAAVNACDGLAPGLYHYDPLRHRLGRLSGATPEVEQLMRDAALSSAVPAERLQLLLIVAARFQRVAWKYASMAYALILKDVGVLYQTMYLAATAMNLAPCALGCGKADLFARAAGTDYYAETSVGEFLLGSRP
jgi:SagB-type dehydrogenase family enzyme